MYYLKCTGLIQVCYDFIGDQELVEFLSDEISHEKKLEKAPGSLPKLKGFSIKTDGTLVTLVKEAEGET